MKTLFEFGPDTFHPGNGSAAPYRRRVAVGLEWRDVWVGVFVAVNAVYVVLVPGVVVRVARGGRR